MTKILICIISAILSLSLTSCARNQVTSGHLIKDDDLNKIKVGTNKDKIIALIGHPTVKNIFGKEAWIYIYEEKTYIAFSNPKVKNERTVKITFNKQDVVDNIKIYDSKEQVRFSFNKNITPTGGHSHENIFNEILSNIGRFNKRNQAQY